MAQNIAKHGIDRFNGFLADLQVWGTPEEVTEKLLSYVQRTDAGGSSARPCSVACRLRRRRNASSCSHEVLPELKRHDVGGDIGVTYEAVSPALAKAPSGSA